MQTRDNWYAVFFLRYWRRWLHLNGDYAPKNKVITLNAYMCVEINAHSLVTVAMTLKEMSYQLIMNLSIHGCWNVRCSGLLIARAQPFQLWDMGLLRRLHCMNICLEAEADSTRINHFRVATHREKGHAH